MFCVPSKVKENEINKVRELCGCGDASQLDVTAPLIEQEQVLVMC